MKTMKGLLFCVLVFGFSIPVCSTPATFDATGSAFPLENQGASARAAAMGSAFVAVGGDASALFWNPASLASLSSPQLALHHNFYLQDFLRETLVFGVPLGSAGDWGFSASYLSYGALQGRDANGAVDGTVQAGRWAGEIAWSSRLLPGFSMGLGIKGNLMDLAGTSYANIAGDLGLLLEMGGGLNWGASYSNAGSDVNVYPAASVVRFGGAYSFWAAPDQKALLAASVAWEPLGITRVNFGAEDNLGSFLALRAGYSLDIPDQGLPGLTGLTAGLGFQLKDFLLDYSYVPFGDLGSSQRISLTYAFAGPTSQAKSKPSTIPPRPQAPTAPSTQTPAKMVTIYAAVTPFPTATPSPKETEKLRLLFSLPENQAAASGGGDAEWERNVQSEKDAIDQNPKDLAAWNALGRFYYQKGRKQEALQCFDEVLRLDPGDQKLRDWLVKYKETVSPDK